MAVEAEFFSENQGFSQNFMIPSTNHNLSLPPSLQHHQPQPQLRFVPGMGMEMGINNVGNQGIISYPCSSTITTTPVDENSLPFADLLDIHKREVDLYLHVQGERLKEAMQHQKRQQMQYLINNYESKTITLMKEKEEELKKQRAKTKLLEECLKKSEQETEVWQSIARENEETVIELNNMLLTIQQNLAFSTLCRNGIINRNNDADHDDAESVNECEAINYDMRRNHDLEERENYEELKNKVVCRWCNSGKLCVVFLPCKHLCCCKVCESVLGLCPLCYSVKQGSMEVFLS